MGFNSWPEMDIVGSLMENNQFSSFQVNIGQIWKQTGHQKMTGALWNLAISGNFSSTSDGFQVLTWNGNCRKPYGIQSPFKFSGQHRMDLKANLKSKNGGSLMEFNDFHRFQVRSVVGIYNTKGNAWTWNLKGSGGAFSIIVRPRLLQRKARRCTKISPLTLVCYGAATCNLNFN